MTRNEQLQIVLVAVALLVVGGLAWNFQLREPLVVDASQLATLPTKIGAWHSRDIPLESTVEAQLRADFNLQRVYSHPLAAPIEVYVGYYGTERGGRPEHTPWSCYPSFGWSILEKRVVEVDRGSSLRANELLVEREHQRHLVHFWYRSYRSTGMVGALDQITDRLAGRLLDDRSDGALVRISTPILHGDDIGARGRLISFASAFDPLLGTLWPDENIAANKELAAR